MTVPACRLLPVFAAAIACLAGCSSSGPSVRAVKAAPVPEIVAMTPRTTADVPFERSWELQLPGRVVKSWIGDQVPDLVFFQLAGTNEIHCIDAHSGQTRWVSESFRHPVLGEAFVHRQTQPGEREREVIIEDRLYIVVDDTLFCLDVGTGQRVWHFVLPFAPSTGPMAAGANEGNLRVYIGDWNNKIQVIGIHEPSSERQRRFPYVAWQMNVGGPVMARGTELENLTYITDATGRAHCFRLDRSVVWEAETGGAIDGGATVRGRVLYAGNASNALHAINRLTGERLGQFNLQGPVRQRPFWFANERDRLYVWVDSPDHAIGGLVALRAQPDRVAFTDGNRHAIDVVRLGAAWRVPGATRLVGSTPLHLLVADARPDLVWAVHRGTGEIQWTWDVSAGWPKARQQVDHIVAYHDRTDQLRSLLAVDGTGYVQAFRMYGFVPTPAQETAGLTSRSLADEATAKLRQNAE